MKIIFGYRFTQDRANPGFREVGLAYIHGLTRLGHEVYLFEDVSPGQCVHSKSEPVPFADWEGTRYFEWLARSCGIWPRCSLVYNGGEATFGMAFDEVLQTARMAEALLNVGGRLKTEEILERIPVRAYLDMVPAKAQAYDAEYGIDRGFEKHDFFFTIGLNIGLEGCDVPICGLKWLHYFPPVVLSHWPAVESDGAGRFTTISGWAHKHTFKLQGRYSGDKADQWNTFIELPNRTSQEMEVAINFGKVFEKEANRFQENGWHVVDPRQIADFAAYQKYITASRAEFSVANNRYVEFDTGWLSDRTARYLASGRPALVQSTKFERHIPTGKGLLSFTTMEEAVDGIERINLDYRAHCRAARDLAEEYFDSDKVLSRMLRDIGLCN
jgi:hypothetical protein